MSAEPVGEQPVPDRPAAASDRGLVARAAPHTRVTVGRRHLGLRGAPDVLRDPGRVTRDAGHRAGVRHDQSGDGRGVRHAYDGLRARPPAVRCTTCSAPTGRPGPCSRRDRPTIKRADARLIDPAHVPQRSPGVRAATVEKRCARE